MKKFYYMAVCVFLLSGCASYKFQRGKSPYDAGYVVYRDNFPLVAYTAGPGNSVPSDLTVAQERFKRRRQAIEGYEKKMGNMDSRLKQAFWGYPVMMVKVVTGIFRLPFIAANDYRYGHNPRYRQKVQEARDKADLDEETRTQKLKKAEEDFITKDLEVEGLVQERSTAAAEPLSISSQAQAPVKETAPEAKIAVPAQASLAEPQPTQEVAQLEHAVVEKKSALEQVETNVALPAQDAAPAEALKPKPVKKVKAPKAPAVKKQKTVALRKNVLESPVVIKAVIIAKPVRGYSPLRVAFSAGRSKSTSGRLVAYSWDFGDSDTSLKKNPTNTYWSASVEPQRFTVTLTVSDDKGNSDIATQEIEVLNK